MRRDLYDRDMRAVRRDALALLRQLDFYDTQRDDADILRVFYIDQLAQQIASHTGRAERRRRRERRRERGW